MTEMTQTEFSFFVKEHPEWLQQLPQGLQTYALKLATENPSQGKTPNSDVGSPNHHYSKNYAHTPAKSGVTEGREIKNEKRNGKCSGI